MAGRNLFAAGAAWLANQLRSHGSVTVAYRRGSHQVWVCAVVGKTEFDIDDEAGAIQRFTSRDYLIQAEDLTWRGIRWTPQPGDRIREQVGKQTLVHEVLSAGGNTPHFRYADPFQKLLRIHTKHVDTEHV